MRKRLMAIILMAVLLLGQVMPVMASENNACVPMFQEPVWDTSYGPVPNIAEEYISDEDLDFIDESSFDGIIVDDTQLMADDESQNNSSKSKYEEITDEMIIDYGSSDETWVEVQEDVYDAGEELYAPIDDFDSEVVETVEEVSDSEAVGEEEDEFFSGFESVEDSLISEEVFEDEMVEEDQEDLLGIREEADDAHTHSYKNSSVTKATLKADGKATKVCSCGDTQEVVISRPKEIAVSDLAYSGKKLKVSVSIKDADGEKIKASNYSVSSSPKTIKTIGAYTATIKFKGDYSGSIKKTFKVNPKGTTISSLNASQTSVVANIKKYTSNTNGYEVQYSTASSFSGAKTVKISKNTVTSTAVKNLKSGVKYYFRVRTYKTLKGKNYYSAWSKAVGVNTKKVVNVKSLPSPTAAPTTENFIGLVDAYNPDAGYYLTRLKKNTSENMLAWFREKNLLKFMDTSVHELYHSYTFAFKANPGCSEVIYLDRDTSYDIEMNSLYNWEKNGFDLRTENVGIPSSLITYRYKTYVSPGATADANRKGPMGLINEFTAYYWGLNVMESMTDYLIDKNVGQDQWLQYYQSLANNFNAYAEFKYWTLKYMVYAKKNSKNTYTAIINNKIYCQAYADAEERYAALIDKIYAGFPALNDKMAARNIRFTVDSKGGIRMNGWWVQMDDYAKLMQELKKSEYVNMDKEIKAAAK